MATNYFKGTANAVAQVANATFGTYDVATTRTITIGGVAVGAVDSGGTLTAALTALAALLNASTHPYFAAITWSSNATQIIGTADTAGVPFVFLASVSGGTGTCSNTYTVATASAGPNDWSTADNWSLAAVPVSTDDVVIKDSEINICWGLDQNGVTLGSLRIEKTYTGKIGLPRTVFATSADGETTSTTQKPEYRQRYLKIKSTNPIKLGEHYGPGDPAGSSRILLDTHNTATVVEIHSTAQNSAETGLPAVRLLANHSNTDVFVRSAPGGVGIAVDTPGETSTVRRVSITDISTSSRVNLGTGVTITTWDQLGGDNVIQAAADITTVTCSGGLLTIEGDFTITTLNVNGGIVTDNHVKTAGNANTTVNIQGGTIDAQRSSRSRTWNAVNLNQKGGTLKADGSVLTITSLNDYAGNYTLSVA